MFMLCPYCRHLYRGGRSGRRNRPSLKRRLCYQKAGDPMCGISGVGGALRSVSLAAPELTPVHLRRSIRG